MATRGTLPECCEHCGATYAELRLESPRTFRECRALMYTGGPPPWRSKSRRAVLGYWHELKRLAWRFHLDQCEAYARDTSVSAA